jgi:hypothetical protein
MIKIKGANIVYMKIERILTVSNIYENKKSIHINAHLTGDERVSLLEEIRQNSVKVTGNVYPQRLRRVFKVIKSGKS